MYIALYTTCNKAAIGNLYSTCNKRLHVQLHVPKIVHSKHTKVDQENS